VVASAVLTVGNWGIQRTAFDGAIVFDGLSVIGCLLILASTAAGLTFLRENPATHKRQFSETVFLVLNSSAGMILFAWSNDLIMTFIGLELMSLCLYVLIALSKEEQLSKEASFKYFILGSFASAVLLYGVSFIYGSSGTTSLLELKELGPTLISTNRMFLTGVVLLLSGLLFKIAVFPFHAWTPDVYQGSPTPVTAYMAAGVKVAAVFLILRFMSLDTMTSERAFPFVDVLQWLTVLTILVGNIGALRQKSMKRMLAYSSVGHSGYVMIGLITAGIGGQTLVGATGVVYYLFAYTLMTLGTFGFLSLLEKHVDHEIYLEDLKGFGKERPVLAASMAILLFSLAGLPPTVGFFGKFLVLSAAIKQDLLWLSFWGVIGAAISVYYYLRPVVAMYMEQPVVEDRSPVPSRMTSQFVVTLTALMVIGFGITSETFFQVFFKSILDLFS
jgi:NADH-quinone oxidoreductase subunit N